MHTSRYAQVRLPDYMGLLSIMRQSVLGVTEKTAPGTIWHTGPLFVEVPFAVRAGRCLLIEKTREGTSWERKTDQIGASPIHREGRNGIWYD